MFVRTVLRAAAYGAAIGGVTYLGKKGVQAVKASTQKTEAPKEVAVEVVGELTHTQRILRDRGMYN